MSDAIVVVAVLVVWAVLVLLALRGWRNRGRRQADRIGSFPDPPTGLHQPEVGPHAGLYIGSTLAPSWQDRIAVGDYGDRAKAVAALFPEGLRIERQGASTLWVPRADIDVIRVELGHAGKVVPGPGVVVVRWWLRGGGTGGETDVGIESGLRFDDKNVYEQWVAASPVPPETGGER